MDEYRAGLFKRVVFARVVRRLYESSEQVWPDAEYPERVRLEILDVEEDLAATSLGVPALDAIKLSANTRGVPVRGEAPLIGAVTDGGDTLPGTGTQPSRIAIGGDLDAYALVARRKEQRKLRLLKFGDRSLVCCDLCGSVLPRRLVVAAHIKRRADASYDERLDPDNVMAACLLGCDALFEHGFVQVADDGTIQEGREGGPHVAEAVVALIGRACTAFGASSRGYFAAHSARVEAARTAGIDFGWSDEYGATAEGHIADPPDASVVPSKAP